MFPVLYQTVTEGTVPSDNGVGILTDALRAEVTEERNGIYELQVQYPSNGIHAKDITERMILKVKPNFTDNAQLFRIYKIGKVLGNSFTIYARHISYDLSGKPISTGTATNIVDAFLLLNNKASNYTFNTDKTTVANFKITEPSSVRSWFGGKEGSILDVYGTGEYHYDNYTVNFLSARGTNRGVEVRYGKNLLSLSQDRDSSNVLTGVIAFWKDSQDGTVVIGNTISTGVSLDVPNVKTLDVSDAFDTAPSVAQLDAKANAYLGENNVSTPANTISLNFLQIGQLKDRVDLCDTVKIIYEEFGIEATAKCIKTVWDAITEKYVSITLGEPKTNITDTIISQAKETASKPSTTAMSQAIENATSLITGNMGGNLIIHDSNNDGKPDELLIMNTDDISTATKVWRFNLNGLGYSSTGYSGTYGLALTMDGAIVATRITTGTLDCSLITVQHLSAGSIDTGILTDKLGKNSWNMVTGEAKFDSLKIKVNSLFIDVGTAIDNAETAAVNTAASDATTKANNALNSSKSYTDTGLAGKVGNNEIRTKFAADATSVTIQSGTITFNSNTFVVNSTNFKVTNTGVVKSSDFSANAALKLYDSSWSTKYMEIGSTSSGGVVFPQILLNHSDGTPRIKIYSKYSDVGTVETYQADGSMALELGTDSGGGIINAYAYHSSNVVAKFGTALSVLPGGGGIGYAGFARFFDYNVTQTIDIGGANGNIRCVSLTQTSSRKTKKNIKPMTDEEGMKVLSLTPVTYDFKEEIRGTNMRGFIAEDVNKIIPELVQKVDGELPAMDYLEVIPYLLKVCQLQEKRICELEAKNDK